MSGRVQPALTAARMRHACLLLQFGHSLAYVVEEYIGPQLLSTSFLMLLV